MLSDVVLLTRAHPLPISSLLLFHHLLPHPTRFLSVDPSVAATCHGTPHLRPQFDQRSPCIAAGGFASHFVLQVTGIAPNPPPPPCDAPSSGSQPPPLLCRRSGCLLPPPVRALFESQVQSLLVPPSRKASSSGRSTECSFQKDHCSSVFSGEPISPHGVPPPVPARQPPTSAFPTHVHPCTECPASSVTVSTTRVFGGSVPRGTATYNCHSRRCSFQKRLEGGVCVDEVVVNPRSPRLSCCAQLHARRLWSQMALSTLVSTVRLLFCHDVTTCHRWCAFTTPTRLLSPLCPTTRRTATIIPAMLAEAKPDFCLTRQSRLPSFQGLPDTQR